MTPKTTTNNTTTNKTTAHKAITTQLDLLRHGQCEGGDIFRGHTDVGLTPSGEKLMHERCEQVATAWDLVLTSPLKRCKTFALNWAGKSGLCLAENDALREMSFGRWDGELVEQVWKDDTERVQAWFDQPAAVAPPGGEPLADVASRVQLFLTQVLASHADKKILVVTHGGVIRVLLNLCLGMPLSHANRWHVPYGCVSRLTHTGFGELSRWQVHGHNMVTAS